VKVLELRGNIRVFVRVRPGLRGEPSAFPFVFVDAGVATVASGVNDCTSLEVVEPQVGRSVRQLTHRRRLTCEE
jgi:hypothetical protein